MKVKELKSFEKKNFAKKAKLAQICSEIKFQKIVLGILPNSECKNVERITFRM